MSKIYTFFKVLVLGFVLSGCATGPTHLCKPGATRDEFRHDMFECRRYAQQYANSMATLCSTGTNNTYAGAIGSGIGSGIIANLEMRDKILECMRAKGWSICK